MSAFGEICMEIEDLYMDGMSPKLIAECVGLSVEQVLAYLEAVDLFEQN